MADHSDDFIAKESCKSFSVLLDFQMGNKYSECKELMRKLGKVFFVC